MVEGVDGFFCACLSEKRCVTVSASIGSFSSTSCGDAVGEREGAEEREESTVLEREDVLGRVRRLAVLHLGVGFLEEEDGVSG